jgi:hypothetical protein
MACNTHKVNVQRKVDEISPCIQHYWFLTFSQENNFALLMDESINSETLHLEENPALLYILLSPL